MGLLDTLLGRSKPKRPNLDALFAVPSAALTLEVGTGLRPTGSAAVCYRAAEGGTFDRLEDTVAALLEERGPERSTDDYGWSWLRLQHDSDDLAGLVTDLHAVNTSLEADGFGPALLCSVVSFAADAADDGRRLGLVYLYKQGTFYPFAPVAAVAGAEQRRDNALELQVRGVVGDELPWEPDVTRWFAVWGAPGL